MTKGKKAVFAFAIFITAITATSQPGAVTDIDGNVYPTVTIGEQEWMAENLRVTRYRNGDPLLADQPFTVWQQTTEGVWAWYDDDADNNIPCGKLYNWYAVKDDRGLCPAGWRVPSDEDWQVLVDFLDPNANVNNNILGRVLKSRRQVDSPLGLPWATEEHPRWDSHGKRFGTDDYGFNALPAGGKSMGNSFVHLGQYAYFWSVTPFNHQMAWKRVMLFSHRGMSRSTYLKGRGASVRCVRGDEDATYHNLSVLANPENAGTLTGAGNYVADAQVNVTATPNEGYGFVNWTIGGDIISTEGSFTYTMPDSDVTLTANFAEDEFDTFDFVIETTSGQTEFSFVVDNAVDFQVNWSNGNTDVFSGNSIPTHDFGATGLWTIRVKGQASRIAFYNSQNPAHAKMLKDILTPVSKGITGITSAAEIFRNTDVVSFTADNFFDDVVENVTDMSAMFQASKFNQDIGHWDVGDVANMRDMFSQSVFNQDVGSWDVSNVTNMSNMFSQSVFNQDIGQWDVGKVTNMQRMFSRSIFNQPIGNWNVGSVTNMSEMFNGQWAIKNPFNQDISDWDVQNVSDMSGMFSYSVFNQFIGDWNVSKVRNMAAMFRSTPFNKDIGGWDVSSVTNMQGMFGDAPDFNQYIGGWNVSNVQYMDDMFGGSSFNQDISNWDVSKVQSMRGMFIQSPFNQNIGNWDVSKVNDMAGMFSTTPFNQDIGGWDVSKVTDMNGMFSQSSFNQDISNWDVSKVTNMNGMFSNSPFNQNIGGWDVSQVIDMSGMFNSTTSFNQDIGNWAVANVSTMGSMFSNSEFNQDIGRWNVSNVKDMSWMFSGSNFDQDISDWDVSSVENFEYFLRARSMSTKNYN